MSTLKTTRFYLIPMLALFLALAVGMGRAEAFQITDTSGKTHSLAGYKGKWVLVNYWATWCPHCRREIPDLNALHQDRRNNLVVIGVAIDYRSTKEVTDHAARMRMSYPVVLGTSRVVNQIGPVQGLPTTYLFNPEGKMVAQQVGPITREAVQKYIASQSERSR